ncbi:MAG: hypothetical protein AAFY11_06900 [Cyanobacteria bacterium J06641_5]
MPKPTKRNPLWSVLRALILFPLLAFVLYFGVLSLATAGWIEIPATVANWRCLVCSALTLYGLIAIFLVLETLALAGVFVAIAAVTSWLDRYGLLEDIITSAALVALVPLSLGVTYLLFGFPAAWWRALVRAFLCGNC